MRGRYLSRDAEVAELDVPATIGQDVARLDVAVDDLQLLLQVDQRPQRRQRHLTQDLLRNALVQVFENKLEKNDNFIASIDHFRLQFNSDIRGHSGQKLSDK